MNLSVVYGRELDGKPVTFGTTGYTYKATFVLYDRATESVWYPTDDHSLEAVSGKKRGTKIEFLAKPDQMPLQDWLKKHPNSKILLGSKKEIAAQAELRTR